MKKIPLTQSLFALVDDSDFKELNRFKWYASKSRKTFYAVRKCKCPVDDKWYLIRMHRQIMNTSRGIQTDHKNGNGLDNQRSNLRVCTHAENQHNRRSYYGTSKYKGVYWFKRNKKWMAYIQQNGKHYNLGSFTNEIDAAKAHDTKAVELFGEFACLNFYKKKVG